MMIDVVVSKYLNKTQLLLCYFNCSDWVTQRERDIETSPTVGFISPSELLRGEVLNLRFEGKLLKNLFSLCLSVDLLSSLL